MFSAKLLTVLSSVTPVEAMFVDGGHNVVAGAMEESPLVVLMTVFPLHFTLLNLQALPQYRVLDPLNLNVEKYIFVYSPLSLCLLH